MPPLLRRVAARRDRSRWLRVRKDRQTSLNAVAVDPADAASEASSLDVGTSQRDGTDADPAKPRPYAGVGVDAIALALFGVGIIALTLYMSRWEWIYKHPHQFTAAFVGQLLLYLAGAFWVIRRKPDGRWVLGAIVLVALGARLAFAFQPPNISDDIYRYVWDGRVQAEFINPYRYPPNDPELRYLRDDAIYQELNRKPVRTIYPPVAQTVFRGLYLLHPDSVIWTKLAFIGFDMATILVLAGLLVRLGMRPERVLLYAWHPLLILELGHSGHVDIVAIFFLALALWARTAERARWTGVLLACATLVKFYAIVALPALLFRNVRKDLQVGGALTVSIALAYLPFLGVGTHVFGYLSGYTEEEGISSGERFYLLEQMQRLVGTIPSLPGLLGNVPLEPVRAFQIGLFLAMTALALWCWLARRASPADAAIRMALLFLAVLVLATPAYPWYWLLALLPLPFLTGRLLATTVTMASLAGLLYLQWWWPGTPDRPNDIVYGGGLVCLGLLALGGSYARLRPARPNPDKPPERVRPAHAVESAAMSADSMSSPAATRQVQSTDFADQHSLFDRFPWLYAFCRERLFRDHTSLIARELWEGKSPEVGAQLLEVGCGPGYYSRRLAARYTTLRATGIDRSSAQLQHARLHATSAQLDNCRFECGDALHLPQREDSVDAVVVSRLFTVLPERERALSEMHRVLRAGGSCFIAEPRSELWTALPLRALWLLAAVSATVRREPACYREPRQATVLQLDAFTALVDSQPWANVRIWSDQQYQYATCIKAESAREETAALGWAAD